MNHIKIDPVGIDIKIQEIQIELYTKLSESWGDIKGFGRVYKTKKQSRLIPEHYVGDGEYIEVLTDDMAVATFFFIESGELEGQGSCLSKTKVDVHFLVDVNKAKSSIAHYADEEVRLEVLQIIKSHFTVDKTIKGYGSLEGFSTYDLDYIHPYFIFRITGIINNY